MTDILDRIAAYKREDVAARKAKPSAAGHEVPAAPRGFRRMLDLAWTMTGRHPCACRPAT